MFETDLWRLQESDAADLFRLVDSNRERLKKFWWEEGTRSPLDSRRFIVAANEQDAIGSRRPNGVTRGIFADEKLIGVAGIHTIDWHLGRAALGYWIDAGHDGQGHATRTVRNLAEIAFAELKLDTIIISPRASNIASRRVAEKNGFDLKAIDHDQPWNREPDESGPEVAHYELTADAFASILKRESVEAARQAFE